MHNAEQRKKYVESLNERLPEDQKGLTDSIFLSLLTGDPAARNVWLPRIRAIHPCKSKTPASCRKDAGQFDEEHCALRLRAHPRPYVSCIVKADEQKIAPPPEICNSTSVIKGFLKIYRAAALMALSAADTPDLYDGGVATSYYDRLDSYDNSTWAWSALFDSSVTVQKLLINFENQRSDEVCRWVSSVLLGDDAPYLLERYLGGGVYGSVFAARRQNDRSPVAIKCSTNSVTDYGPPRHEVAVARRFEKEGVGFAVLSDYEGLGPDPVDKHALKAIVAGPSRSLAHEDVRPFVGWYALDRFDVTLSDFLGRWSDASDAEGTLEVHFQSHVGPSNVDSLADGIIGLLRRCRAAELVHGDLHDGNIGVILGSQKVKGRRVTKKAPEAWIVDRPTKIRLLDFGRSYGRVEVEAAARVLADKKISVDFALITGAVVDALTLERWMLEKVYTTLSPPKHSQAASLKRRTVVSDETRARAELAARSVLQAVKKLHQEWTLGLCEAVLERRYDAEGELVEKLRAVIHGVDTLDNLDIHELDVVHKAADTRDPAVHVLVDDLLFIIYDRPWSREVVGPWNRYTFKDNPADSSDSDDDSPPPRDLQARLEALLRNKPHGYPQTPSRAPSPSRYLSKERRLLPSWLKRRYPQTPQTNPDRDEV